MKYLKTLALAAVAAAALLAVVGAGTASATTVICGTKGSIQSPNPCPAGVHEKEWPANEPILATATGPKLVTNLLTVECTSSTATVTPEGNTEATIKGKANVSFTGCFIAGSPTSKCEVTIENAPYSGSVTGTIGGVTGKSELVVNKPRAKVKCGSFINCTYEQASVSLEGTNGSGSTNFVADESLGHVAGLICPSTSTWEATYNTSEVTIH